VKSKRVLFFCLFVASFLLLAYIALFINDRFVRPYLGDVLVVICIYFLAKAFFPSRGRLMALYIFVFAVIVEVTQLLGLIRFLGLENNPLARIVLGGVFDWIDIGCYAAGCLVICIVENIAGKSNQQADA